jgi:nucleoside-diphosphate-sugar epimerase
MQISILGCGWLGLPLAKALINDGHTVNGTTTTPQKLETLQGAGINPFLIDMENYDSAVAEAFLAGSELLIINIPPKAKSATVSYPEKMRLLLPQIIGMQVQKVLFIGSTSVFADGFPFPVITDATVPNPDSDSSRQLLEAEQALQGNTNFTTTILRFAGLIGEDRHPVHHLAGRTGIANPKAPVNLIHRDDCIGYIKTIIEKQLWGKTFNAAAPQHPSRKNYYRQKATEINLQLPIFEDIKQSVGKIIESDENIYKLIKLL